MGVEVDQVGDAGRAGADAPRQVVTGIKQVVAGLNEMSTKGTDGVAAHRLDERSMLRDARLGRMN